MNSPSQPRTAADMLREQAELSGTRPHHPRYPISLASQLGS
ncbi:hypothetical protein HX92_0677 [Mycobacterium tuberculosis]|nr:Uncharacterized protein BCGR_1902 [Mycobacterium tuberculosis variant bovis BCG]AOZ42934.1 hypothetical protein BTB1458_1933 [Mycobacterium tuberculosis]BAL65712.1 hypothetical protein ERDMAN_1919 [Mycobacterium tuberculosis str. Erdman = ATCC 35801]BAQ05761.1 hypothetical protein KURONO_1965 [Mycobacterium tuberculosis str. Kurono]KDA13581.1 hypothetical protein CO60_3339 [Mycobacterium tuberculosis]